jgi:4-amino-4-deoxy-L-arabinose transferase-like glycosyltransferase
VLAITPIATLMFRFNNPDALLVLLMTVAAYAMVRAVESGRTRWIVLAGALLGFGFLTKMLQAFLVLPAFALVYLVAGPPRLGRRIWQLLAGGAALLVAAGWWVALVQFTPAADRPYVGGSTNNSVLQLALGYNGLGRLTGNETGSVGFNRAGGPGGGGGGGGGGGCPPR